MRLLASIGRFLSRIGSTRSYEVGSSPVTRRRSSVSTYQIVRRPTTTGAFHSLDKIIIEDSHAALEIAARLTREEQSLLREALEDIAARQDLQGSVPMTEDQTRALFLVNSLPFIGFGFLDNVIMIVAGEYIDHQLGTMLCLSTMAAAALGNLISDVAGVGLAHYVESMFHKIGLKHPVLTSEQLESSRARWTTHSARAFGLTLGCLVGMFPLLFFNNEKEEKNEEPQQK
ncbi:hypothetical protein ANCCAN_01369 [Ancylostoma caninum]|uniref:Transmembrane protein 65 n=1 Tax=Ancylostoma caninum TaxID=29170 RepID=A0A368HAI8_ANCCA|nr:hypothetical protein ANCCAN_01369 [Ancylostoma caninum]